MGAGLPPSSSRNRNRSFRPMAEINVTPMVDVMLVLLVVFMIAAPLMNSGVPVELPSHSAPALQEKEEPVTITVTLERALFIGKDRVTPDALEDVLRKATGNNLETRIYLRADQALTYGAVMGVMNSVREAGYTKVALVSEPTKSPKKKRKR